MATQPLPMKKPPLVGSAPDVYGGSPVDQYLRELQRRRLMQGDQYQSPSQVNQPMRVDPMAGYKESGGPPGSLGTRGGFEPPAPGTGGSMRDPNDPNRFIDLPTNPNRGYQANNQMLGYPNDMMYANWYDQFWGPSQGGVWDQLHTQGDYSTRQQDRYQRGADNAYSNPTWNGTGDINPQFGETAYRPGQTYTPDEINSMVRPGEFQRGMTTPEQFDALYLTDQERAGMRGDPMAARGYFDPVAQNAYRDLDFTEQRTFDALAEQDRNIRGNTEAYYQGSRGALDSGAQGIRGAAYSNDLLQDPGYRSRVSAITGNNALGLSGEYSSGMNFTDKDLSDLESQAGRAVGARYQSQMNDLEMQAAAQQMGALGVADAKNRYNRESAADAADAATAARLQGRGLQLDTLQRKEDTRLGAESNRAGLQLRGEEGTESMRLSAAQRARQMQMDAEDELMRQSLGIESNRAQLNQEGERYLGSQRLASYGDLANLRSGTNQWVGNTGAMLTGQAEQVAAAREAALAANRQTQGQFNTTQGFQQNYLTQQQLADRYGQVAQQRLDFERERRGYQAGMSGQYYQGGLTNTGQQVNMQGTRQSGTNAAAANYGQYQLGAGRLALDQYNSPTGLERGIAAGLGVASLGMSGYKPGGKIGVDQGQFNYKSPVTSYSGGSTPAYSNDALAPKKQLYSFGGG